MAAGTEREQWLHVLGLNAGAGEEAIRQAYHDLVKVWHPDRFGTDERLRRKAEDKLRELNVAYERLQKDRPESRSNAKRSGDSTRASGGSARADDARSSRTSSILSSPDRLLATLVGAAALGAVGAWFIVTARRHVEQPATMTAPLSQTTAAPGPPRVALPPARTRSTAPRESGSAQPAGSLASTGSLLVQSQPSGASIRFDGELVGETPLTVTDIAPGEHRVALDLQGTGYRPWSTSVVITAGSEEKLLAIMTAGPPPR